MQRLTVQGIAAAFAMVLVAACSAGVPAPGGPAANGDGASAAPSLAHLAGIESGRAGAAASGSPALPTSPALTVEPGPAQQLAPAPTIAPAAADSGALAAFDAFRTTSVAWGTSQDNLSMTSLWSVRTAPTATDAATRLRQAAQGFLAWLDAHPPRECYRTVWQRFHDAAQLVIDGANAYLAGDTTTAQARIQSAAQQVALAVQAIPSARTACQAAG